MDISDTIEILQRISVIDKIYDIPHSGEALDLAIKALEKQIPKKPEWTPAYQSYFSAWNGQLVPCPGCGDLIEDYQPICFDCYQVIDWGVGE